MSKYENIFNKNPAASLQNASDDLQRAGESEKLNTDLANRYRSGESSVVVFNAQRVSDHGASQ